MSASLRCCVQSVLEKRVKGHLPSRSGDFEHARLIRVSDYLDLDDDLDDETEDDATEDDATEDDATVEDENAHTLSIRRATGEEVLTIFSPGEEWSAYLAPGGGMTNAFIGTPGD